MRMVAVTITILVAGLGGAVAQDGTDAALSADRVERQTMTVTPEPGAAKTPTTPEDGVSEATKRVRTMVEEQTAEDPETNMTEAKTGDAAPTENWFGCEPDAADQEGGACQPGSAAAGEAGGEAEAAKADAGK